MYYDGIILYMHAVNLLDPRGHVSRCRKTATTHHRCLKFEKKISYIIFSYDIAIYLGVTISYLT